jgi:hypothetical protein
MPHLPYTCDSLSCLITCFTLIKSVRDESDSEESSKSILPRLWRLPAQALVQTVFELAGTTRCGVERERILSRYAEGEKEDGNGLPNQAKLVLSHPFFETTWFSVTLDTGMPFSRSLSLELARELEMYSIEFFRAEW